MKKTTNFDSGAYFQNVGRMKLTKTIFGLKAYLKELFRGIEFSEKNILDIGAGTGMYSCYMAMNGATKIVSLEPELEGSGNGYTAKFEDLKDNLGLNNVFLKSLTFQSFNNEEKKFDIILLHHSINHLDEDACINLKKSEEAREIYRKIFEKLYLISSSQARIIIADCSSKNIFSMLKIKNPFAPSIEWHKHQPPNEWAKLLKKTGFRDFEVKWIVLNPLGGIANFFLGNKICSFIINSHFIIYAKK
ncbi:MAG: hypothetical protein QG620_447 [Patescibacteria group bacterium]|nr:hypothetical protein [Patescibacteria group bacterium]